MPKRVPVSLAFLMVTGTVILTARCGVAVAEESASPYYTDPATGVVYRKVYRTVERPVVETKMTTQEQTVYTPETVVQTKPEIRRTYTPVTEFRWLPRVEGRWNPFRQPTVSYHHVPETHWQARDEVVNRSETRTTWKAEKRTSQVPQQLARIQREQVLDFEPIGRVAPQTSLAQTTNPVGVRSEVAARLRPLSSNTPVQSLASPTTQTLATRERIRSDLETGMRPTDLIPDRGTYVPGPSNTTGIAGLPATSIWR
ncbi:MAG: hypothetical protein AAGC97_11230 [Planctomycetota bacterium]